MWRLISEEKWLVAHLITYRRTRTYWSNANTKRNTLHFSYREENFQSRQQSRKRYDLKHCVFKAWSNPYTQIIVWKFYLLTACFDKFQWMNIIASSTTVFTNKIYMWLCYIIERNAIWYNGSRWIRNYVMQKFIWLKRLCQHSL